MTGGYFIDPAFREWLLSPEAMERDGNELLTESFQYWIKNIASPKDVERVRDMAALYRTIAAHFIEEGSQSHAETDAIRYGESLIETLERKK